jgi:hypothetical protein
VADFTREKATILEVYRRRVLASGEEKYIRLPFNLVTYDDASGQYIQPISIFPTTGLTYYDVNNDDTEAERLIVDTIPFDGVTEIR